MNNISNGWLALIVAALGALAVAALLALNREDITTDSIATPTPRSGDIAEWACPQGTDGKVTCGYVQVPAKYSDPDGETVQIFVASIGVPLEATGAPMVFLGDRIGPGAADNFSDWREVSRTLSREIVLIDHRGTGLSEPRLNCIDLPKVSWLELDLDSDGPVDLRRAERQESANRCVERLGDLPGAPDFSTDAVLRDIEEVRKALSIEQWMIAASGETVPLAVAIEERAPETVESLVLLRASMPASDRFAQRMDYAEEALTEAVGCETTSCSAATTLVPVEEIQTDLGARSLVFTASVGSARQRVSVNRASIFPSLALTVVDEDAREAVAPLLDRVTQGQWRELALLRGRRFRTHDYGEISINLALSCDLPTNGSITRQGLEDEPSRDWLGLLDDPIIDPDICPPLDPASTMNRAPSTDVLVLNQSFDYLAPRSAARELQRRWPDAEVQILESGSTPALWDLCVLSKVSEFIGLPPTLEPGCL